MIVALTIPPKTYPIQNANPSTVKSRLAYIELDPKRRYLSLALFGESTLGRVYLIQTLSLVSFVGKILNTVNYLKLFLARYIPSTLLQSFYVELTGCYLNKLASFNLNKNVS
jgi:hypothetical protein